MLRIGFTISSRVAALSAALLAGGVAAAPADAQTRPPVVVRSCTILQAARFYHRRFWSPWGPTLATGVPVVDGVRIVYVNVGSMAASRVAFLVNYRGDVQHIIDVGTFSPSATIDHTFGNFSGDAYLGSNPNRCVAVAVRFADGSVWRASRP
jgi:hypothetical protein